MLVRRKCDWCGKTYQADTRNLKRGWGLCCSKSCAAHLRESKKPGYNPETVKLNNIRRANWVDESKDRWAHRHGYPDYETYENDIGVDDEFSVTLEICPLCGLRSDYCRCGEGADMY